MAGIAVLAMLLSGVAPTQAATPPQAPGTYRGLAFDTCQAPNQATMDAWKSASPFGAIGIYVSGHSRYCGEGYQPNLTPTWVRTNAARGWRFLPIHVGYQSPCFKNNPKSRVQKKKMSSTISTARQQARSDAADTIAALKRLGFGAGSVSYLDLEWYKRTTSCDAAVISFIDAWTQALRAAGYRSGVYSSGSAAIQAIDAALNARTRFSAPDQLWIAWTNGKADTNAGPYLNARWYADHRRIHQYKNGSTVTYGGRKLTIDWDAVDVRGTSSAQPAPKSQPTPKPTGAGTSADVARLAKGSTPKLKYGSKGEAVSRIQRALTATGRPVPVTGYFGYQTARAVMSYRHANGLGDKAKVSRKMWAALQRGINR